MTPRVDSFKTKTEQEIINIVKAAKAATCASDPIPTRLIKENIDLLCPTITKIVNASLQTATFDSTWKEALLTPLIKKPNMPQVCSSYRPVSNLPFISKVVERAALLDLESHLELNTLLGDYQSAYRRNYSSETALIKLTNTILENMENKRITSLIAADLSAAFDTVDHRILVQILSEKFNIKGRILQWIVSYLEGRSYKVKIENVLSKSISLDCSVPQGSILGPVLFNCYASTLADFLNLKPNINNFADDHSFDDAFCANDRDSEKSSVSFLEDVMLDVCEWTRQLRLQINPTKSEFVMVGSRQMLPNCTSTQVYIDGDRVKRSNSIKLLGVQIDENLTLRSFVNTKVSRAANNIHRLRVIRKFLSVDSAKTLASSLVNSHFDYCNALLYGLPQTVLQKMQTTQNWGAKVVINAPKYSSATKARKQLHWLPIAARTQFKIATLVHKCLHNKAPVYLQDLLVERTFSRVTRQSETSVRPLLPPLTRRSTYQDRSFSVGGTKVWNNLPNYIRKIDNLSEFKKELKTLLFDQYYGF